MTPVPFALLLACAASQETPPKSPTLHPALPPPAELAKLPPDGGTEFNRLVFEASPYLQQHARNPVEWYPWGAEAFARAKAEGKPVFLSVGYSTCHWCHVMERESFEDAAVAKLLNEGFVCIKVDREERPDLDALYMAYTQAATGNGGWPMTVFLTPEKEPFFAGTYFPKQSGFGRPGMLELVPEIAELWRTRKDEVVASAKQALAYLGETRAGGASAEAAAASPGASAPEPDRSLIARATGALSASFDEARGGFGTAPKFPSAHQLLFLLGEHRRTGDARLVEIVVRTLRAWRDGGIFDQLGYGMHRYSTDAQWLVPHFEKMLYDQALALMAYTAAWQVTGEPDLRASAEEIVEYVLRDLASPAGGFFSAEDADSEGEEGRFYVWTRAEVLDALGPEEGELFARAFGVEEQGNFQDVYASQTSTRSVLSRVRTAEELAAELSLDVAGVTERLERSRKTLLELRARRVRPLRDEKVLTDWNGLMIAALARAAAAFDEPRFAADAVRAADFALANLRDQDGRLLKRWRDGVAGMPGTLDDYAFLAFGLIELYQATFETRYLAEAIALCDTMLAHFADAKAGGFFLGADDAHDLPLRTKDTFDGALPSGTSIATLDCLLLARFSGRTDLEEAARRSLRASAPEIAQAPAGFTMLLTALDFALGPTFEIVVAGDPTREDTRAALAMLRRPFVPDKVLLLRPPGEAPPITRLAPYTLDQRADGAPAIYLCRDFACQAPTTDILSVFELLNDRPGDQR
jgi:uncharacterized protein YyaL (SSP411 family)